MTTYLCAYTLVIYDYVHYIYRIYQGLQSARPSSMLLLNLHHLPATPPLPLLNLELELYIYLLLKCIYYSFLLLLLFVVIYHAFLIYVYLCCVLYTLCIYIRIIEYYYDLCHHFNFKLIFIILYILYILYAYFNSGPENRAGA